MQKKRRYAEVVSFYNRRNKQVIVAVDFAVAAPGKSKNYKYAHEMNGYSDGYYNIVVTQYEPDSLAKYLEDCEIIYNKKEMNGKYQVGSGRIVTVTHDTPFIEDIVAEKQPGVNGILSLSSDNKTQHLPGGIYGKDVALDNGSTIAPWLQKALGTYQGGETQAEGDKGLWRLIKRWVQSVR